VAFEAWQGVREMREGRFGRLVCTCIRSWIKSCVQDCTLHTLLHVAVALVHSRWPVVRRLDVRRTRPRNYAGLEHKQTQRQEGAKKAKASG